MMTQARDGISLAHRAALRIAGTVGALTVVAVVFSAAFLSTAGTSYAKLHKGPNCPNEDSCTENTVVVGNAGAILGGSYEVFAPKAKKNTQPLHEVKGNKTGLHGVSGAAITSDGQTIAIGNQLSGSVTIFGSGATGNSAPSAVLAGPDTGMVNPTGVAFLPDGTLAVASTLGTVVGPDSGEGICAKPPAGAGFSLGVISEFSPGASGDATPFNNSPVVGFDPVTMTTFARNATIGGCMSFLVGPTGLWSEPTGKLWAANSFSGLVTSYAAEASGDTFPDNIIAGAIKPAYVAANAAGTVIYVSDLGDNSVKIFDTTTFGGALLGTLSGKATKFRSPLGVAFDGDDLYVANTEANNFVMFDDDTGALEAGGNVRPDVVVRGAITNMNQPTGLAVVPLAGGAAASH